MRTQILPADAAGIAAAAAALAAGQLVALPTETVYGLAASVRQPLAVAQIFEVKGRPADHPLIVHLPRACGSLAALAQAELVDLGSITPTAQAVATALIQQFWPGPLTLILPRHASLDAAISAGMATVGLRMPAHPGPLGVLAIAGPVAMPSANRFTRISPTTAEHVLAELAGRIPFILEGGAAQVGVESTIVAITPAGGLQVLRLGGLTADVLAAAVGAPLVAPPPAVERPRVPGQMRDHYAPITPVWRLAAAPDAWAALASRLPPRPNLGLLLHTGLAELPPPLRAAFADARWSVRVLSPTGDAAQAARDLYASLRQLDSASLQAILIPWPPPSGGLWATIGDRLQRASRPLG